MRSLGVGTLVNVRVVNIWTVEALAVAGDGERFCRVDPGDWLR